MRKPDSVGKEFDVGEWSYEKIDFDEDKKGFRIYSNDVRGTFRREMLESYNSAEEFKKLPFSFSSIIKLIYDNRSVRECMAYLETIWELCILCPLPYYENEYSPVNFDKNRSINILNKDFSSFIRKRQIDLIKYDFALHFDGILLNKLVQLPSKDAKSSRLYYFDFDKLVFESKLKFSGYIFSQVAKAIRPFELNGIQVRLRNVGIGGYDQTLL